MLLRCVTLSVRLVADLLLLGTCVVNCNGDPIILYTGVKLRSNHVDDLPDPRVDLNLPFIEVQLAAVADRSAKC